MFRLDATAADEWTMGAVTVLGCGRIKWREAEKLNYAESHAQTPFAPNQGIPWIESPDGARPMDRVNEATRSRNMAAIKGKNTKPEMAVRRLLHALGYRYRLHRKDVPGNPDIAFLGRRKAIFIHGCFWHQHAGCKAAHVPLSRPDYWRPKLARNAARDAASQEALSTAGWSVLVLWECEIRQGTGLKERLVRFLGPAAG